MLLIHRPERHISVRHMKRTGVQQKPQTLSLCSPPFLPRVICNHGQVVMLLITKGRKLVLYHYHWGGGGCDGILHRVKKAMVLLSDEGTAASSRVRLTIS